MISLLVVNFGKQKIVQNAFYDYMISHNFKLERGIPIEESGRKHLDLKEYKDITNFDKTKEKLQNIKLELPDVPNLEDINVNRLSKKRDEKIIEEIIKPKDNLINELYQDNLFLQQELTRQARIVEKSERYQRERDRIIAVNEDKIIDNCNFIIAVINTNNFLANEFRNII